ncbi:unnamed protein product [Menidia menidia]|uniref:(Atlantic silverside) hypothetical protein n=1 Tax=Menidia menidia TaxID=238744 RepID=A0A8S4ARX1_9TELE|nr:unnamed protein product [Menidia menidia]
MAAEDENVMMTQMETGEGVDLLMECDEEEPYILPVLQQMDQEKEALDADLRPPDSLMKNEEERDTGPVRIIPIPVQPETSRSPTASRTVKSVGSGLSFTVNGRRVPLLPGGSGTELRLHCHPEGSASGFTTVQIPVTVTVHSPVGTRCINTMASLKTSPAPAPSAAFTPLPEPNHIPVITDVVSGEAAQKVLNDHKVNFESNHLTPQIPPPFDPTSTQTAVSQKTSTKAIPKRLQNGDVEPVVPPNCSICSSQYKYIPELRGFMCLCSPAIALSLRNLKKQMMNQIEKKRRRSRNKNKSTKTSKDPQSSNKEKRTCPKSSATRVVTPPQRRHSDDFESDVQSSPGSPSNKMSLTQQNQPAPPSQPPQGKLVILVEDFYYGCDPGRATTCLPGGKMGRPYPCIHCPKTFSNNIKLMNHMHEHASMISQLAGKVECASFCPHCFRPFLSPLKLQSHLESVHNGRESTVKCKICEVAFDSEPDFLCHMKSTHRPGEMPYACQVCDFRSSFYSDVWSHFELVHSNTKYLMCPYCLRVLRNNNCYQQHVAQHQKKYIHSCEKCRLHFLYIKERTEHKLQHHKTHITPPQLSGLKPGTKVTVRTYSVAGSHESGGGPKKTVAPCKVVDVAPPPPPQESTKKKPVESLGPLLSQLSTDSDLGASHRCIECLHSVPDLKVHFPSLVRCSLCRFVTCCSTSYANHMIINHSFNRDVPQFSTIFQSAPRLPLTIRSQEWSAYRPETPNSESGQNGAFVPIHLMPCAQTWLSVKPLPHPSPPPFTPAMTIKFLGPKPAGAAVHAQLSAVLSALCHGAAQAARQHQTPPATIRVWISQQQRGLSDRKWLWRTEKMAEWMLYRREQQLSVDEDALLQKAQMVLGGNSQVDFYRWTVDFMLRHELGLQTSRNARLKAVLDSSHAFMQKLISQIQSRDLPPNCLGCLDELPVFINLDQFSDQDPQALKLFGSPEDRPLLDVTLSALSDGSFLPPLLFFTGTSPHVPDGFPDNVILEARQEGFTDEERMQIWLDKVWQPHVTSKYDHHSLLLMDQYRGHVSGKCRKSLSAARTIASLIPPGCGCRLQPLEICVTHVLRDFLQARWTQLVSDGGLDGLELHQLALTLACWLSEVSSTLNSKTHFLRRSFSLTCTTQTEEDHGEAERMISALAEALIQPMEAKEPILVPKAEQHQAVLLLAMKKEIKMERN